MTDYGYNDIGKWIEFLIDIETNMLKLPGEELLTETLALERKVKYQFDISRSKQKRIRIIEHQKEQSLHQIYLIVMRKYLRNITSYEQLNFIKGNLSNENSRRLIITDPEIQREEIIEEHIIKAKKNPLF